MNISKLREIIMDEMWKYILDGRVILANDMPYLADKICKSVESEKTLIFDDVDLNSKLLELQTEISELKAKMPRILPGDKVFMARTTGTVRIFEYEVIGIYNNGTAKIYNKNDSRAFDVNIDVLHITVQGCIDEIPIDRLHSLIPVEYL